MKRALVLMSLSGFVLITQFGLAEPQCAKVDIGLPIKFDESILTIRKAMSSAFEKGLVGTLIENIPSIKTGYKACVCTHPIGDDTDSQKQMAHELQQTKNLIEKVKSSERPVFFEETKECR